MITDDGQRHTERRITWRPRRDVVSTRTLEVVIGAPAIAKAFVEQHHYSGTCAPPAHPALLYDRGELVGAACFGPLASMNAHRFVFPTLATDEGMTLGRFVLLESVAFNAESWFIARCFPLLRKRGVIGIESCADPRWGHIGQIYQATNGDHVGLTNPSTIHIFEDGTELSNRTEGKARRGEVGRRYAVQQLVGRGATPPDPGDDMHDWTKRWRIALTRNLRHRGKYRYMWCLDRRRRREVMRFRAPAVPEDRSEGRMTYDTWKTATPPEYEQDGDDACSVCRDDVCSCEADPDIEPCIGPECVNPHPFHSADECATAEQMQAYEAELEASR